MLEATKDLKSKNKDRYKLKINPNKVFLSLILPGFIINKKIDIPSIKETI